MEARQQWADMFKDLKFKISIKNSISNKIILKDEVQNPLWTRHLSLYMKPYYQYNSTDCSGENKEFKTIFNKK